jgi:hypothetical protein
LPAKIVELVGLPGAGKTAIAGLLRDLLVHRGGATAEVSLSVSDWKKAPLSSLIPSTGAEFRLLYRAFAFALPLKPAFRFDRFRVALPLATSRRRALSGMAALKSEVRWVVLDEWNLQRVWAVAAFAPQVHALPMRCLVEELYVRLRPLVVYLKCDPALAASRIAGRDSMHSRFDRLPPQKRMALLSTSCRYLDLIVASATACDCKVIEVEASVPAISSAKLIAANLGES